MENSIKIVSPLFLAEIDRVYKEGASAYIKYFSEIREFKKVTSIIKSRYAENEKEYLELASGENIDLESMESINDFRSEDGLFDGLSCSCD